MTDFLSFRKRAVRFMWPVLLAVLLLIALSTLVSQAANTIDWQLARLLGDPLEAALVEMAEAAGGVPALAPKTDEVSFDADRRRMSTLHEGPDGPRLYSKGAPETMIPLCASMRDGERAVPLDDALRRRLERALDDMTERGLRVLVLAWRALPPGTPREDWERGLVLAGLVGLEDPPRPEVPEAIARCRSAGIRVIMATGDHPHTAAAIAREIGLAPSGAPTVVIDQTDPFHSGPMLPFPSDASIANTTVRSPAAKPILSIAVL